MIGHYFLIKIFLKSVKKIKVYLNNNLNIINLMEESINLIKLILIIYMIIDHQKDISDI